MCTAYFLQFKEFGFIDLKRINNNNCNSYIKFSGKKKKYKILLKFLVGGHIYI